MIFLQKAQEKKERKEMGKGPNALQEKAQKTT